MNRYIFFLFSVSLIACGGEVYVGAENEGGGDAGPPETTLTLNVADRTPGQVLLPGTEDFYIYLINLTASGGGVEVESIRYAKEGVGLEDDWGSFHVQMGVYSSSEETLNSGVLDIPVMMSIPENVTVGFGLYGDVLTMTQAGSQHYFSVLDENSIVTDADLIVGDFPLSSDTFTIGEKADPHCDVDYLGPNADNGMTAGTTDYYLMEFSILCNRDFTVQNTYIVTGIVHPPGMEMVNPNEFLNNIRIIDTDTSAVLAGPGSFLSDAVLTEDYGLQANVQRNLAFVVDVDAAMPPGFKIQGGVRLSDGVGPDSYLKNLDLNYFLPITGLSHAGTSVLAGQTQTTN